MSVEIVSMVEALRPRACKVAELLASRVEDPGLWAGYKAEEGMVGELRLIDLLTWHRPGRPEAVLVFRNPQPTDVVQIERSDPVVLETNIVERYRVPMNVAEGATYEDFISQTFTKTRTLLEQLKAGLELGAKVGGEAGVSGGIHGVTAKVYAELSAKLYAEYQRQWGESETESNTASRKVTVKGPAKLEYEAWRSVNREQRRIRADCDYDHSVELIDERQGFQPDNRPYLQLVSDTWLSFLNVVQGFAPRSYEVERDGRKELRDTAFYQEFINQPVRGAALSVLAAPAEGAVEQVVEYDRVVDKDISII